MKRELTLEQREELEAKIAKALKPNIRKLSTEFQKILVDDLVTAFQNRMNVLILAQQKGTY